MILLREVQFLAKSRAPYWPPSKLALRNQFLSNRTRSVTYVINPTSLKIRKKLKGSVANVLNSLCNLTLILSIHLCEPSWFLNGSFLKKYDIGTKSN